MIIPALAVAKAHHGAGRIAEAIHGYEAILAENPNEPQTLHLLGLLTMEQGDLVRAERLLQEAVKVSPTNAYAWYDLGLTFVRLEQLGAARHSFARAAQEKPDYAEALFNLALTFQLVGEEAKASILYRQAITLKPDFAAARFNFGVILHAEEKFEEAIGQYRQALAADASLPMASSYIAAATYSAGDMEGARRQFETVLSRAPENALAHYSLARIRCEAYDIDGAVAGLGDAFTSLFKQPLPPRSIAEAAIPVSRYPVESYREALPSVSQRLAEHGIRPFLVGGLLIGALRDDDFLDFDKDIDFGLEESVTPADLARALDHPDFRCTSEAGPDGVVQSYRFRETTAIDFFWFYRQGNQMWCGLDWYGQRVRWLHRSFDVVPFHWKGVNVYMPRDADTFLTECYGDWRVPDPFFPGWAARNIEGGLRPVTRMMAYGQIFRETWLGHHKKAMALCDHALAIDATLPHLRELQERLRADAAPRSGLIVPTFSQAMGHTFDDFAG